jgi:SpoVK/Ycf46/Vps4 family AAA+-type ATPase
VPCSTAVGSFKNAYNSSDEKDKNLKILSELEELNSDKLNLSTLLSRLDGIGNYGGLIIIGTSNNILNIDKALYRDGRLNLMKFDLATSNDIQQIVETFYQMKIYEEF